MGVISVLGPAGSLVTLINATSVLSNQLYDLARAVRAARKDIRRFARNLNMFSWSSNEACACLLRHYSNEERLDTLSNAKKKRFLRRAEESAREILEDVENICPRILEMEPSGIEIRLISKFKWYQRKSEVRDLTLEMGALQTSLALLMSTVTYEVQIRNKADPETLAAAMAQITNFREGAEDMASKFEKLSNAHRDTDKTLQRLSKLLDSVVGVAGKQLDDADEAREATGLYEPGRWVVKKDAAPITNSPISPKRSRMETRAQRTPSSSLRSGSPPNAIFVNNPSVRKGKGKEKQIDPEPPQAEASSSRGLEDPIESNRLDSHNASNSTGPENDPSTRLPDTRLPQGAALKYFIAPSASDKYKEISGYISKGTSRDPKTLGQGILLREYPTCSVNAISRAFARQLGLEVTPVHSDTFGEVFSETGFIPSPVNPTVGEIRFWWHTKTGIHPVGCKVFENEILPGVPLALGMPYIRQVERERRRFTAESSKAGTDS